jgi:Uma2 family endonuclease
MVVQKLPAITPPELSDDTLQFYYDSQPTEEDLIGDSYPQFNLIFYLVSVLRWFYRTEGWLITANLNIYQTGYYKEAPVVPNIAIFKRVVLTEEESARLKSWKMRLGNSRPAPQVVFEISSDKTWKADLNEKVIRYQQLGVKEYFAYDPNVPQYWPDKPLRLKGWRYEGDQIIELVADKQGRLWSEELESWLKADRKLLRLYDQNKQLRPTQEEARLMLAEVEQPAKEKAWAKLRELGIDPEKL